MKWWGDSGRYNVVEVILEWLCSSFFSRVSANGLATSQTSTLNPKSFMGDVSDLNQTCILHKPWQQLFLIGSNPLLPTPFLIRLSLYEFQWTAFPDSHKGRRAAVPNGLTSYILPHLLFSPRINDSSRTFCQNSRGKCMPFWGILLTTRSMQS